MNAGTEGRERVERLALIHKEAERLARQAALDVSTAYRELGSRLAFVLEAAAEIDERIAEANRQLRQGGVSVVETVRERVAIKGERGVTLDVFASTSIVPIGHRGWGEARREAERVGIVTK